MRPLESQAEGLFGIAQNRGVKVIAVASGKGGVGKTHLSVNLGVALAARGCTTLLLDADLGLANVDVLLGLKPRASLEQVISGELALEDIIIDGPCGLKIVPAASGVSKLAELSPHQQHGLISAFSSLPMNIDVMVVDTATGIDHGVTGFCAAAHEVAVVVCDEPTSLTDAYALIKVLSQERGVKQFQILCNKVRDPAHGLALYRKISDVCERFLDVSLQHFGSVPQDEALTRASRLRKSVVEGYPMSPSARAFKKLAASADNWAIPDSISSRPVFFLERMLAAARPVAVGAGD